MEKGNAGTKNEVPTAYHYLIKIHINKHNMVLLYNIWKNVNQIQLKIDIMDLNNQKTNNHPPSPEK